LAVVEIENELARRVVGRIPSTCNSKRFVPYIQLHELEAVFFADPDAVAGAFDQPGIADRLRRIVLECDGCETINDRFETKPSQRLQNLFPNYRKGASAQAHAPLIADRMSLETARKKCPHFSEWLTKLEAFRTV
jgi:hypothetical protein